MDLLTAPTPQPEVLVVYADCRCDSTPAPRTLHRATRRQTVRRIVHLPRRHRLGPVAIAARPGMPASTAHAVLRRCRLHPIGRSTWTGGLLARRELARIRDDRDGASRWRTGPTWRQRCAQRVAVGRDLDPLSDPGNRPAITWSRSGQPQPARFSPGCGRVPDALHDPW